MIIFGMICVAICLFGLLYCYLQRVCFTDKQWLLFSAFFTGSLMLVAFCVDPPENWDLSRHYELVENMRHGGLRYVLKESIYAHLPIINMVYALVALIGVPNLLPCIAIAVCYWVLAYSFVDMRKHKACDSRFIACAIVFWFAFCPFLHLISGIRNIMAYALCALGFYKEIYHKQFWKAVILYVTAFFIHPASVIVIAIRVIFPFFCRWRWISIIIGVWSLFANFIAKALIRIPINFFSSFGWKLNDYLGGREFSGYKVFLVKMVYLIAIVAILEFFKHKGQKELRGKQLLHMRFLELTILFMIGSFKVIFIADRLIYFIAFLAIPALAYIYKNCRGKLRIYFRYGSWAVGALSFVHQVLYFINTFR